MTEREINEWLAQSLPRYENLTATVVSIFESLLRANDIDFLAVSGRTKTLESTIEKLHRKNYKDPKSQLTDLSAIRVILYFESQVDRASKLGEDSFRVDPKNSMNRDAILSIDQIGYRSVHFVCDLGPTRTCLPEYMHLANLKFEIQLRTVLQHAWAELAHDRNYNFSGKLPRPI
jgi:ppGpp synthetase/RelA/SpoT-type nucleotidyltranferase